VTAAFVQTSDPGRAPRSLLEGDRMFTEHFGQETKRLGLRVTEVDTTMTGVGLAGRVTEAFAL
jgi:hypothetical protein